MNRPKTMNHAERAALLKLVRRDDRINYETPRETLRRYRRLRRTAYASHMDCWIIPDWCGMTVGIERDGHTHT